MDDEKELIDRYKRKNEKLIQKDKKLLHLFLLCAGELTSAYWRMAKRDLERLALWVQVGKLVPMEGRIMSFQKR